MMDNSDTNWIAMSNKAIINAIGSYIKHQRLAQNKTQAKVAEEAGLNRSTLSQIEKGESSSILSLIQVLRTLNLLHLLNQFKIENEVSPIELAKLEKQKRLRAKSSKDDQQYESEW